MKLFNPATFPLPLVGDTNQHPPLGMHTKREHKTSVEPRNRTAWLGAGYDQLVLLGS